MPKWLRQRKRVHVRQQQPVEGQWETSSSGARRSCGDNDLDPPVARRHGRQRRVPSARTERPPTPRRALHAARHHHSSLAETKQRPCLHKNFLDFDTVALLFLFDKHYLIMEKLDLKDSSRDL